MIIGTADPLNPESGLKYLPNPPICRSPGGGGGDSHMEQTGMLVGNFGFNP